MYQPLSKFIVCGEACIVEKSIDALLLMPPGFVVVEEPSDSGVDVSCMPGNVERQQQQVVAYTQCAHGTSASTVGFAIHATEYMHTGEAEAK